MEKTSLAMLIAAFITLVAGMAFVSTISGEIAGITKPLTTSNETFRIPDSAITQVAGNASEITPGVNISQTALADISGTEEFVDSNCIREIRNHTAGGGALVLNTDYRVYCSEGLLQFLNSTTTWGILNDTTGNLTVIDYEYEAEGYLETGWNRTVLNLTPGFFALALLGVALLLFYSVAKKEGII